MVGGLGIILFLFISPTLKHMNFMVFTLKYIGSWLKQSQNIIIFFEKCDILLSFQNLQNMRRGMISCVGMLWKKLERRTAN